MHLLAICCEVVEKPNPGHPGGGGGGFTVEAPGMLGVHLLDR